MNDFVCPFIDVVAGQGNFVRLGTAFCADPIPGEEKTKFSLGEHAEPAYSYYWNLYGESNGQLDLPG